MGATTRILRYCLNQRNSCNPRRHRQKSNISKYCCNKHFFHIIKQQSGIAKKGFANRGRVLCFKDTIYSIKEFAVIERQFRKRDTYDPTKETFSLMHVAAYDGDDIREAINTGDGALISALRSDNFFPISSCVELIAERVIELFNGNSDSFFELFFDDRILLSKED
jgi:hypothetical protein